MILFDLSAYRCETHGESQIIFFLRSMIAEIMAASRQLPPQSCVVMCSSAVNISWLLADSRIERCHEGAEGLLLPSCLTKVAAGDTSCPR